MNISKDVHGLSELLMARGFGQRRRDGGQRNRKNAKAQVKKKKEKVQREDVTNRGDQKEREREKKMMKITRAK